MFDLNEILEDCMEGMDDGTKVEYLVNCLCNPESQHKKIFDLFSEELKYRREFENTFKDDESED